MKQFSDVVVLKPDEAPANLGWLEREGYLHKIGDTFVVEIPKGVIWASRVNAKSTDAKAKPWCEAMFGEPEWFDVHADEGYTMLAWRREVKHA